MSSIIIEKLYGQYSHGPVCSVLTIGDFKILLDCGWDHQFDLGLLQPIRNHIPSLDAVLITHSDLYHCGALPFLVGQWGLKVPIFMTNPISTIAFFSLFEHVVHLHKYRLTQIFSIDYVNKALDLVQKVTYRQIIRFRQKGKGIRLIPHCAGHSLGGTAWFIETPSDTYWYMSHINHAPEYLIRGCSFGNQDRPSLVFLHAPHPDKINKRQDRENTLCNSISHTLNNDGAPILIPVDTGSRMMDLLLIIKSLWSREKFQFPVYIISPVSDILINTQANTLVSWMTPALSDAFVNSRELPFTFSSHFHFISSTPGKNHEYSLPAVYICPNSTLESGPSLEILQQIKNHPFAKILLLRQPQDHEPTKDLLMKKPLKYKEYLRISEKKNIDDGWEEIKSVEETIVENQMLADAEEEEEDLDDDTDMSGTSKSIQKDTRGVRQRLWSQQDLALIQNTFWIESQDFMPFKTKTKSNDGKVILPGKLVRKGQARYMVPFYEDSYESDDYGAILDLGDLRRDFTELNKKLQVDTTVSTELDLTEAHSFSSNLKKKYLKNDFANSKLICRTKSLELDPDFIVESHEFVGCSSGYDIQNLFLDGLKPVQICFLSGNPQDIISLYNRFQNTKNSTRNNFHMTEKRRKTVVKSLISSCRVKIDPRIMKSLNFHQHKDYSVSWVEGVLVPKNSSSSKNGSVSTSTGTSIISDDEVFPSKDSQVVESLTELELEPVPPDADVAGHRPLKIGNTEFHQLCDDINEQLGIQTKMIKGQIICNNCIIIKKIGSQGIYKITGPLTKDYYSIRRHLNKIFSTV